MKYISWIIKACVITVCVLTICCGTFSVVHAQTKPTSTPSQQQKPLEQKTYVPLTDNFPQLGKGETKDFAGYFNSLMKIVIGLVGILAVLMIVIGGIQYVSTDSVFDKDYGKKRIQAAVGGLVLALSSYLILNSIDPSLTYVDFTKGLQPIGNINKGNLGIAIPPQNVTPGAAQGGINTGGEGVLMAPIGEKPITETPENNAEGLVITPSKVAIDNDGRTRPPFQDDSWQSETACTKNGQYLDAGVDRYVVVPVGSPIPCNSPVRIINNTTGQSIMAFVGDFGPGYGEMSRAAAQALGLWVPGMGDEVKRKPKEQGGGNYNITYIFLSR
jgi:Type IV secretion system pilin